MSSLNFWTDFKDDDVNGFSSTLDNSFVVFFYFQANICRSSSESWLRTYPGLRQLLKWDDIVENRTFRGTLHCKKRLSFFSSPAGMSLTKPSLTRNY
jgi:hypothetical protein